jgi:hypothetical protein
VEVLRCGRERARVRDWPARWHVSRADVVSVFTTASFKEIHLRWNGSITFVQKLLKEKVGPKIPDFESCIAKRDYVGAITLLEFNRQNAPKVRKGSLWGYVNLPTVVVSFGLKPRVRNRQASGTCHPLWVWVPDITYRYGLRIARFHVRVINLALSLYQSSNHTPLFDAWSESLNISRKRIWLSLP